MYDVTEFIRWALTHVNPETIPAGAVLARPFSECGIEPWHYLYGTVRVYTTEFWLNNRWENYYKTHGYPTREDFDKVTIEKGWKSTDRATDCQGLLDAWLTYEVGEKTDINANMNYTSWCTDKGLISEIDRPWVVGEAIFRKSATGSNMAHIGWICGFVDDEPLIVEAKGLLYGVVVTRLSKGNWTHRGLMTKKFEYPEEKEPVVFKLTYPRMQGPDCLTMQKALNALGWGPLNEDGVWGPKSDATFQEFIKANTPEPTNIVDQFQMSEGGYTITITKE